MCSKWIDGRSFQILSSSDFLKTSYKYYSGSHLISYRLIEYPVYNHANLKSKTIYYAFPYILLRFIEYG